MQVLADAARAALAVVCEQLLQFRKQIGFGPEVTEHMVAALDGAGEPLFHIGAVVAVEAVALDESSRDALAPKDLLESTHDRGRPGTGRPGDRDDWMFGRHVSEPPLSGVRSEQATRTEERRIVFKLVVVTVIPLDALDLVACPEYESDALVRSLRLHLEDGLMA